MALFLKNVFGHLLVGMVLLTSVTTFAEDASTMDKAKKTTSEAYQDSKKNVKQGYRKVKDEACEMINGKMDCAVKKAGNTIKNGGDEVKDKIDDVKKK